MKDWIKSYLVAQKSVMESIPVDAVDRLIETIKTALDQDRQIFVFGNGGSASNASHFATDLGKGSSDKIGRRFRVVSLNDNVSWMTAIGNDYCYEDVYLRQLINYGRAEDVVLVLSVSGSSPNLVRAVEWARKEKLKTIALVGAKKGRLAEIAEQVVVVNETHYGRAEDAQMAICHMICYAFIENPQRFM